jgi:hypothetical protein
MPHIIEILPGENLVLERYEDATVDLLGGQGPLVTWRLVGSIRPVPATPSAPAMHRQATTLEIRMDPKAAMMLAANISDLARKTGWQPPPGVLVLT